MELTEYIHILRKRILMIIVITQLSTFTSAVVSFFLIKPVYKADIAVIIGKAETTEGTQSNYNDLMMYQKLVKTYSELAKTRIVAVDVISKLNLNISQAALLSMVSVAPKGDTEFITITVKSKDVMQAVNIANQLAKSLKEISIKIKNADNVYLVDEAQLPTSPDSPNPKLNMAIAFFMGLMVSVGIVFLLEYLDNTVKTQADVEKLLGLSVLGIIPLVEDNE